MRSLPSTASRIRLGDTYELRRDPFLQRERAFPPCGGDRMHRGCSTGERRDARDTRDERGFADRVAVAACTSTGRGVDDKRTLVAPDQVDDCAPLLDLAHLESCSAQRLGRPTCRHEVEAETRECGRDRDERRLVRI